MKKYIFILSLMLAAAFTGCGCETPEDTHITDTEVLHDAAPDTQAKTEPLWEGEGYYLTEYDGTYALFNRASNENEPFARFSEYHTANFITKDGSEGTRHLAVMENGDGTGLLCTLDPVNGYVVFGHFDESVAFYGDFILIDGILYSPQMRVRGIAEGLPIEDSPRYDGVITFENMRCYFAPVADDEIMLIHESDSTDYIIIADGVNGQRIGLYKEANEYRARAFDADIGGMTKYGAYIREVPLDVDILTYGEYTVVKAYETSFVIDKDGDVIETGVGAYLWRDGYFVFDPFDNMAPMTLYNRDFSLFCDRVSDFRVIEGGILACVMLSEYSGDIYSYDDDYSLRMYHADGTLAEYGVFDELIYFSERYSRNEKAMCCAFLKNDREYSLIESDGSVIFTLTLENTVDFYGVTKGNDTSPHVLRFILSDNAVRDIEGRTKYIEYVFDPLTGKYEGTEYYHIPVFYTLEDAI